MTWKALFDLLEDEFGLEAAIHFQDKACQILGGVRVTVPSQGRKIITREIVDKVAPGKPKRAAQKLGVSTATIYRTLRNERIIR